jgi:threonine/homoserine/homoserine lactone efflux protein
VTWELLARGLVIGFAIAAPVGPIGLLCIQRTLNRGRMIGLATGMGAASADAMYGLIAGFGLTAIAAFLTGQRMWLGVVGGLFLCYLGVRTLLTQPALQAASLREGGLWSSYASAVLLTLTNPLTIFSFMAVFAGLGLGSTTGDYGGATALVAGVFLGSAAWWMILSGVASGVRAYVQPVLLRWVNRGAGVIMLGFGLYLLLDLWAAG